MPRLIDWNTIYAYYIGSEATTLKDCAKQFHMSHDVIRQHARLRNWTEKKRQALQLAFNLMEERTVEEIAKRNIEHVRQSKLLEGAGLEAIAEKGMRPRSFLEALKAIEVGQQLERTSLGMDQKVSPRMNITNSQGQSMQVVWGDGTPLHSAYDEARKYGAPTE